jgi:hypothetical protein
MTLRHLQVVTTTLVACAAFAACSGAAPPPARAFVQANLGASRDANGNNLCNSANAQRAVLNIGTSTGMNPTRVNDGDQNAGGTVHVQCSVDGGFDVVLGATLGGSQGGIFQVAGHVDAKSGGQAISVNLTAQSSSYAETDCTISFLFAGGAVPDPAPISQGRIWAHTSCPKMANQDGHVVKLMDGTSPGEVCSSEVDFIFENCS